MNLLSAREASVKSWTHGRGSTENPQAKGAIWRVAIPAIGRSDGILIKQSVYLIKQYFSIDKNKGPLYSYR
jgi:hypothetical protein